MNLPIHGDPLEFTAYFNGKAKFHLLGLLGGALWYGWLCTILVAARAEAPNILMIALVIFVVGAAGLSAAVGVSANG
jgi:hypothetical protein